MRPNGQEYKPRLVHGHEDLAWLRYAREHKEPVLFVGPPGTGKTSVVEAAYALDATHPSVTSSRVAPAHDPEAQHFGIETIVCGADTTEADFFGTFVQDPDTGNFRWSPGPLHRAVLLDIPLYVDEIFLAESRVLAATIYPLMDGRDILRIPMNPTLAPLPVGRGFVVLGSGNPDVPGAVFSDALRDRFQHIVEVGTDWDLAEELGVPERMVNVAKVLDEKRRDQALSWSPQLRSLLAYRDAHAALGLEYALAAMLGKAPTEDQPLIAEELKRVFRADVTPLQVGRRAGRA